MAERKKHNVHGGQGKSGQGKGKPKMNDRSLGKALIKQQMMGMGGLNGRVTKDRREMTSILDSSNLKDYVEGLAMEGKPVEVRRTHMGDAFLVEPTAKAVAQRMNSDQFDYEHLKIPRKPAWTRQMTAEEVDRNEKDAFLAWRRDIAMMEEAASSKTTPFEKNLEVWRQLWRVMERSDMAIQIVDARNPLLYFTQDLAKYAAEQNPPKAMMLLVNKADFLTEHQRRTWARYFVEKDIRFAFYSAHDEQARIDKAVEAGLPPQSQSKKDKGKKDREDEEEEEDEDEEDEDEEEDEEENEEEDEEEEGDEQELGGGADVADRQEVQLLARDLAAQWAAQAQGQDQPQAQGNGLGALERGELELRRSRVLTRAELILLLTLLPKRLGLEPNERNKGRIVVGMMGFPNVGKSSVINTILGVSKSVHGGVRVGVSSTPGKTKHFQTLVVSPSLMLCDCPGLVFPSFMRSNGEMLCAGILPINQMRDYQNPADVISTRVSAHLLEAAYGVTIRRVMDVKDNPDRPPTGSEVLCAYCATKGYITSGTGRWDEFRACKELLRDFTDGVIVFVAPPPGMVQAEQERARWAQDTERVMMRRERIAERVAVQRLREAEAEAQAERQGLGGRHGLSRPSKVKAKGHAGSGEKNGGFVFGDGAYDDEDDEDDGGGDVGEDGEEDGDGTTGAPAEKGQGEGDAESSLPVFDDESSDDDDTQALAEELSSMAAQLTPQGLPKREHKRVKRWGKKQRALRDKNPYGEENGVVSYVAYSTNRPGAGVGEKFDKSRQNLRVAGGGMGAAFMRQALPHHHAQAGQGGL